MAVKTGIYVRVSTEEQAQEGYSIRGQTEKLKSYSLLKDWIIHGIYSDEGISGKNIVERPAINRLIQDIKSGKVNNVLVFKVDRLTRSTKNLIELVELFDKYNCTFNSLTESIDTETPSGRMFLKIIGIFAEFERENLVSRLKLGFERKAKEGYSLASFGASFGYDLKKGEKIQTINQSEAKIVREIFDLYVNQNISMTKITEMLNNRKIKPKRKGEKWSGTSVRNILLNPNYIGKIRYSTQDKDRYFETDGHHEPIIENKVFELAQEKLIKNNARYNKKAPDENNYFCGFLYCEKCGSTYTTHHSSQILKNGEKKEYTSYKCNGIKYKDCVTPQIIREKMNFLFEDYIKNTNINDFDNLKLNADNNNHDLLNYIAECENKLKSYEKKKKRLMERFIAEEIEFDNYKQLIEMIDSQYADLENEFIKVKSEINAETNPVISREDIILNLKENWQYLDSKERMIFLQRFVKKIVINGEKTKDKNILSIKSVEFNSK
ncbi:MAG: recombinase family protein [Oscillospiraceae bacterium]|nr:recombinase family protein [Oscillospiraceae bacterium]